MLITLQARLVLQRLVIIQELFVLYNKFFVSLLTSIMVGISFKVPDRGGFRPSGNPALPAEVVPSQMDQNTVSYASGIQLHHFLACRFHEGDDHRETRRDDVGTVGLQPG